MTRGSVVAALVLSAGLAGCSGSDEPVVGDEPITPEAVVAIAQEHVGVKPNRIWKDSREGEDVSVRLSGPRVTSDPRNLDLGVPLEDLAALVTDQRLSVATSQEIVDLGDAVERAWG